MAQRLALTRETPFTSLLWRPANHPLKTRKAAGVQDAGQLLFLKCECGTAKPRTSKTAFQTRASRGPATASFVLLLWQETLLSATQNYVTAPPPRPMTPCGERNCDRGLLPSNAGAFP